MVAHFGMSPAVGPIYHEREVEHPFLGQRLAMESAVSEATSHEIEDEARRLLVDALESAKRLVRERRAALDRLVRSLLDRETLERDDIEKVLVPS